MDNYYNTEYLTLKKSKLTPPKYVFGIVWPILYVLMAISFVIIYMKCKYICFPLKVYILHIILNIIWTYLFIKIKTKIIALIDILIMICLLIYCMLEFHKYSIVASTILLPYLIWLCFAAYLNIYIVFNN